MIEFVFWGLIGAFFMVLVGGVAQSRAFVVMGALLGYAAMGVLLLLVLFFGSVAAFFLVVYLLLKIFGG